MEQVGDHAAMTYLIVLLLLVAIGPLAVRYGADSRLDEPSRR
jgi:hypothetical protein